jgi:hypothetical protein
MKLERRGSAHHVESSAAAVSQDDVVLRRLEVSVRTFRVVVRNSLPRLRVADRVGVSKGATRSERSLDSVL